MGFFQNFFGKNEQINKPERQEPDRGEYEFPEATDLDEMISTYGTTGYMQQDAVAEVIEGKAWEFDKQAQTMTFGGKYTYKVQILGTYVEESKEWLWAWANDKSGLPPEMIQASLKLKKYGEEHDIDHFTDGCFGIDGEFVVMVAMIGAVFCGYDGYYIGKMGKGELVVLVKGPELKGYKKFPQQRLLKNFIQFIGEYEVENHSFALRVYLESQGYTVTEVDDIFTASRGEEVLTADFDEEGRLTGVHAN